MKKAIIVLAFIFLIFTFSATAQDKVELPLEQLLERDAQHNLKVAWGYFKQGKAYKAALMRTGENRFVIASLWQQEVHIMYEIEKIPKLEANARPDKYVLDSKVRIIPLELSWSFMDSMVN